MIKLLSRKPRSFFFFNDTATTEIYTLSLHDALPISSQCVLRTANLCLSIATSGLEILQASAYCATSLSVRSEEHTSELQSRLHLVCRLLLEKKKAVVTEVRSSLSEKTIESLLEITV